MFISAWGELRIDLVLSADKELCVLGEDGARESKITTDPYSVESAFSSVSIYLVAVNFWLFQNSYTFVQPVSGVFHLSTGNQGLGTF